MAENIRNIKLRLNLDKPEDRRANEILSSSEQSMSQFIIAAVNAYGNYLCEEEAKRLFIQQVNNSLRNTLLEILGTSVIKTAPTDTALEISSKDKITAERSAEKAGNFLKSFF